MKRLGAVLVVLVVAAAAVLWWMSGSHPFVGPAKAAPAPAPAQPKKEYKVLNTVEVIAWADPKLARGEVDFGEAQTRKNITDGLNKLGEEGWDLVTVVPPQPGHRGLYYFKRTRQ